MRTVLKILVSVATLFYGLVPAVADLNETHLLNPQWSAHARFHAAWFLAFTAGIAATALYLIWRRGEIILPILFGLLFALGFWIALIFRSAYGGALVDSNGYSQKIIGLDSNVFLFSVLSILLVVSLGTALFGNREGQS
ncbi:MAG: DUF6640 family protein [Pseudomonadota bacterium]